jgi:hypothetical protein
VNYRNNAAPPPPDPLEEARKNARHIGYLQLFMAVLNAVNVLTIFTTFMRIGRSPALEQLEIDPAQIADIRMQFLYVTGPYVLLMLAWAGLNYMLLGKRGKAAFYSSILYAIASLASCFGIVMVIVLFVLLFKKEMKDYFTAPAS